MAELRQLSIAALVDGLWHDLKTLIALEVRLARTEVLEELDKVKTTVASLALGIGLIMVGGLLLIVMLVHFLEAIAGLPLWVSYGIVGGLLAAIGGGLLLKARNRARDIRVVPLRTVQTIKENVTWLKQEATTSARM